MMSWQSAGFRIEITGDGSPSLRQLTSVTERFADGEAMHHSGGASAETDLIYGHCVRQVFAAVEKPHFLVVGLGLGYIEMFIAKEALLLGKQPASILSFESLLSLRSFFYAWVHDKELPGEIKNVYDHAAACVVAGSALSATAIKAFLKAYFRTPDDIHGALEETPPLGQKYHGLLYDAFSSKTSPTLWDESFITHFLREAAAETAFLSTYACKGSLKRALLAQGFSVEMLLGFEGKRYRIRAQRPPRPNQPLLTKEKFHKSSLQPEKSPSLD